MAEGGVAESLASAFVRLAIAKLGSPITQQASLLWNFGNKDLEAMKELLETISAVLEDAERRSVTEQLVRLWLKGLKDAAIDISDMVQDYQDTSDQATAKNLGVLSFLPCAYKKTAMAKRVRRMREKLSRISMEFKKFEFTITQNTTSSIVQNYDKCESSSRFVPDDVNQREGEKWEIINLICASTNNDESRTVIVPIYGLGGVGKTTLAQLVFNDHQFKKYDHRIWVSVSRELNLCKVGITIISQLQIDEFQESDIPRCKNVHKIRRFLDMILNGKKVLIVIDDLWEEDNNKLMKLKKLLLVGKKGSMIDVIVTTREEGIARNISTSEPYNLQPLNDSICWEIIKEYSMCNQREFELIGLEIAKKCGGLPLAAQTLGCMLLKIKDLAEWEKINNSDIWNETSKDRVHPSLKLSYQRMRQQLRICFSYCALFPKGHNIVEDDLIQQWSALGFIETSLGKEYVKQLLGMSFLQVSKLPMISQESVAQYTMHDLVHDLARLTIGDELMDVDVGQTNLGAHKYCYYSLLKNYDRTRKLANILPPKMRAVRFSGSDDLDIRSGAFSFAKCLRTLDFGECSGILLPTSIGRLKQLRYLVAPRVQNESLPNCITELSKLQYLNINGSFKLTELPKSIGKLGCLKYLCLSGCSRISKLAESFGDLKCMVHLDISGCSRLTELPDSLGNLTHLQHLELSGCSSLKALPQSLCSLTQLQYLNLSSCACLDGLPEAIGSLKDLHYLNISRCKQIRELPESMVKLQNLLHLDLSGCIRMQHMGGVPGLTALQHLDMSQLHEIGHKVFSVLPNLTNLKYLRLRNVIRRGSGHFIPECIGQLTNLEYLNLSCNFGLFSLPDSIGNLKRLHTLDISRCFQLLSLPDSIAALRLKSLLMDGLSDELRDQASSLVNYLLILPDFKVRADDVFSWRSNLHLLEGIQVSELRILSLENVRSLKEANKVKLSDKHNLSKLTLAWRTNFGGQSSVGETSAVQILDVKDRFYKLLGSSSLQILEDKDLLEQLVPPRGLKSIHLQGYNSTSFPGWLMCISGHLINLVSFQLSDMPRCINLPPLGQLPHLESLVLHNLPGIKRIDSEFCGGKGAFRRLSSFKVKYMKGLEEWNTTYSVEDGVEEFMFPVLDSLDIWSCPRLRLAPCPPTFQECSIYHSGLVISSLEELDKTSHHCSSSGRAIKLKLKLGLNCGQSIKIFHHFPALRELTISVEQLPESMRHITSLEFLKLDWCESISALPEWLGDLSSLRSLVISRCEGIKSLPACIQQLTKLQTLEIRRYNRELKEWCESEENKAKLAHINVFFYDESRIGRIRHQLQPL